LKPKMLPTEMSRIIPTVQRMTFRIDRWILS